MPTGTRATGAPAADPAGIEPALALLELSSIAVGIEAGDAMAKRAPIEVILAGTVHPGKYLVLVGGAVADVEEALAAGREVGAGSILDTVLLPSVDPQVVAALRGRRLAGVGDALGIVETATVASTIDAADAGVKGARVELLELRLADGLGGKGYLLFDGDVADVEAAVELGVARVAASPRPVHPVIGRVIPRLHDEMRANLEADARFGPRTRESGDAAAAAAQGGPPGPRRRRR